MREDHTLLVDQLICRYYIPPDHTNLSEGIAYRSALHNDSSYASLCDAIDKDIQILNMRPETLHAGLYELTKELYERGSTTPKGVEWIEAFKVVLNKKKAYYADARAERNAAAEEARNKLINKAKMEWSGLKMLELADEMTLLREIVNRKSADPLYKAYETEMLKIASNDQILQKVESRLQNATERPEELCAKLVAALIDMMRLGQMKVQEQFDRKLKGMIAAPSTAADSSLAILLYGKPGTGKTTLAEKIGNLFSAMGLLVREGTEIHSAADFIGQYMGQTAPKTRNILIQHLEKSLFLDEAYDLTKYATTPNGNRALIQYSEEAINTITALLNQLTGRICFIVAGYEKEMFEDFLPANVGLDRRFTIRFLCPDKTPKELATIFVDRTRERMCGMNYRLPSETVRKLTNLMKMVFEWAKKNESSQLNEMNNYDVLTDIKRRVERLQYEDAGQQRMKKCSSGDRRVRVLDRMANTFEYQYCRDGKYNEMFSTSNFVKYKEILKECKGGGDDGAGGGDGASSDASDFYMPCLYEFFKNQAGAMSTLADEAIEVAAYYKYQSKKDAYDDNMLRETILNKVDESMFNEGQALQEFDKFVQEDAHEKRKDTDHLQIPTENVFDCTEAATTATAATLAATPSTSSKKRKPSDSNFHVATEPYANGLMSQRPSSSLSLFSSQ